MRFGKAVKLYRTQRGLSQSDLARMAEISVSYLSLLEREKRDPTFSTIESLAVALNVPLLMLVFLASTEDELSALDSELREKLSYAALQLTNEQKG